MPRRKESCPLVKKLRVVTKKKGGGRGRGVEMGENESCIDEKGGGRKTSSSKLEWLYGGGGEGGGGDGMWIWDAKK